VKEMESPLNKVAPNIVEKEKISLSFKVIHSNAIWIALLFLIIIGSFSSEYFLTFPNIINIIRQTAVVGLLAMGLTIVLITGSLDFTLGSIVALTTVTIALMQDMNYFVVLPILLSIGVGIGLLNSFVVTKLKLESFIATLGVSLLIDGVAHFISNSQSLPVTNSSWRFLGSGDVMGLPLPVIIYLVVGILLYFVLSRTVFGRYIYATGGNPTASKISGVPTQKIQILSFILGAVIAVLAGIILAGRISSGDPAIGLVMSLDAIIIAVLGGAALTGGKGNIQGAIAAALVITVLFNIFNLMNFPVYAQMVARGLIMISAISMQRSR
jgi:ribose/xylose/arabinose/galactoside ABC-type transport system permease subunit